MNQCSPFGVLSKPKGGERGGISAIFCCRSLRDLRFPLPLARASPPFSAQPYSAVLHYIFSSAASLFASGTYVYNGERSPKEIHVKIKEGCMNCGKRVSNKKIVPTSIGQGFLTSKAVSAIEPEASLDGGKSALTENSGQCYAHIHSDIPSFSGGFARLNRRKEGMQFSVNMRQDMFPAEPDMRTNTSRVRPISFLGNKWGNLFPPA